MSDLTPSQTVGPFFAYGLTPKGRAHWDPDGTYSWKETIDSNLVTPDVVGDRIRIEGGIFDGDGKPIPMRCWKSGRPTARAATPNEPGSRRCRTPSFKGFGRSACDGAGVFQFDTVKPGAVAGPDGKTQAPHIVVAIFARGMLRQVYTRIYFDGEAANATDPVLDLVPADRRATLMAKKQGDAVALGHPHARRQGNGLLRGVIFLVPR